MSNISKIDVEHVATLARLKLTSEETDKFTSEIGEILGYAEELSKADTSKILGINRTGSALSNIARLDRITNANDRENLLSNAPAEKNGFIKVKKIFE